MKHYLIIIALLLSGCGRKPEIIKQAPPAAFLYLPPAVEVPEERANHIDLVNYLYQLHDSDQFCRAQIKRIEHWSKEQE